MQRGAELRMPGDRSDTACLASRRGSAPPTGRGARTLGTLALALAACKSAHVRLPLHSTPLHPAPSPPPTSAWAAARTRPSPRGWGSSCGARSGSPTRRRRSTAPRWSPPSSASPSGARRGASSWLRWRRACTPCAARCTPRSCACRARRRTAPATGAACSSSAACSRTPASRASRRARRREASPSPLPIQQPGSSPAYPPAATASRQVSALRDQHHVYMPMDGRLCMAALTQESCATLAAAIKDVLLASCLGASLLAEGKRDHEEDAAQEQPEVEEPATTVKRPRASA